MEVVAINLCSLCNNPVNMPITPLNNIIGIPILVNLIARAYCSPSNPLTNNFTNNGDEIQAKVTAIIDIKNTDVSAAHISSMIATMPLERTDKFTIAVNDEQAYDFFFKRPPLSIRANVYVMLVDLEEGKVVKEKKLCEY